MLRSLGQAAAPVVFGILSESVFGGGATGLDDTFLCLLSVLLVAALLALLGLRTYARDVATIAAATFQKRS